MAPMLGSRGLLFPLLGAGALCFSCSGKVVTFGTAGGDGGAGAGASGPGSTGPGHGGAGASGSSSFAASGGANTSGSSFASGSGGPCPSTDENVDMDGDGWTPAQGDCNDCDPNVNPGAVDVPGDPGQVDHDCDGKYDPPAPCDTGLALDDVDAGDAARAIDLCQTTPASPPLPQKTWGVIGSQYVRADGAAFASPGLQTGLQSGFGPNVNPQVGQSLLALSSGHARTASQPDACGSASCVENADGTPPVGFPQTIPGCAPSTTIADDVALELDIRTPTNATGYAFSFKFYSMEFPFWVCDPYNDQFVALASPAPAGAMNGNISFDGAHNPVSTMLAYFDVCDPTQSSLYASDCHTMGSTTCPALPNPYCQSGTMELLGTGFDVWDTSYGGGGATRWLSSQAPVVGGSELTLRFAIWDGGDQEFDSTILIDGFQWITGPAVVVSTTPVAQPK